MTMREKGGGDRYERDLSLSIKATEEEEYDNC